MTTAAEQAILDAHFMARALELARKGHYTTHPNPRVGCVVVRDGQIVGEGWHLTLGLIFVLVVVFLPGGIVEGVRRLSALFRRSPPDAPSALRAQPAE